MNEISVIRVYLIPAEIFWGSVLFLDISDRPRSRLWSAQAFCVGTEL